MYQFTLLAQAGVKMRNWLSVGAKLQADWPMDEAKDSHKR